MTAKQQLFVAEFLIDLNATQAAIRAGYSAKTAQTIGSENLTKPIIGASITDALKARRLRTEITQDRVLEELALVAFADIPEETVVKVGDKLTALDRLAKHLGMFAERHHHSGEVGTSVRDMSDEELHERVTAYTNRISAAHTNADS